MKFLGIYGKSIVVLVATIAALFVPLLTGDHSGTNVINVCILAGGLIVTWVSTEMSAGIASITKTIVAAVSAALVVASSALSDGVTNDEWKQIVVAAIMVVLTAVTKNAGYVPGDERANPADAGSRSLRAT